MFFHNLSKPSFEQLNCTSEYDKGMLAEMINICYDCYGQYLKPEIDCRCR